MIKDQILKNLKEALKIILHEAKNDKSYLLDKKFIDLQPPANLDFGDYSTSVALKLSKKLKKNPLQIAEEIVRNFPKSELIEKVQVVKPGFVNFWLSNSYLISTVQKFINNEFDFPCFYIGPNKKIMVEFAHPNSHKLFHIGHLRNISIGESICRILATVDNKIIRSNYQGDVGLHIAKCLYIVQKQKEKITNLKTSSNKMKFLGQAYAQGEKAYENDGKARQEIHKINKMIYEQDAKILPLWQETRRWSLDYFNSIYKRVYSKFDRLYFESELPKRGMELVNLALQKKILEKSKGAIIFNGKKYGLDTRVFVNTLGLPTYEGKELALAEKEFSDFGEIDKCLHVVTPEQSSFFKVTFKVEELLDAKKYKNKQQHLSYNWVRLKHGKMASRLGNVIEGPWLIDNAKKKIKETYKCKEDVAEILAVSSIKYSFLKYSLQSEISFDLNESIALEGNSAPYLIYTYVRCQSVLNKAKNINQLKLQLINQLNKEEKIILRQLIRFPEVVYQSAESFSPNYICNYLFELCQAYNLFYQKYPILKAEKETKTFRLTLTQATAEVIKKGLYLLGIKTVSKM